MEQQISPAVMALINVTLVFVVLFFIALLIQLIYVLVGRQGTGRAASPQEVKPAGSQPVAGTSEAAGRSEAPKVAAVCAAIAAYMNSRGFRIVGIRRPSSQAQSLWLQAARLENVTATITRSKLDNGR